MKIVPIFANNLFAVAYDDENQNEFVRLLSLWNDVEYLFNFAEDNKINHTDEFIEEIIQDAHQIDLFINNHNIKQNQEAINFNPYFENLSPTEPEILAFKKAKRIQNKTSRLRIYAIKIDDNVFLITGGAIKVSQTMQEHPDTQKELSKLKKVKDYLKQNVSRNSIKTHKMKRKLYTIILFTILAISNFVFAQKKEFIYYIAGQDNKLQILNESGKPISNETYSYVGDFSEGLLSVKKNEKFGFINKNGKLVIPYMFDDADKMLNGVSVVKIDGKYGLINRKGNYKIKPQFEDVYFNNLKKGFITFKKDGLFGLIDIKGNIILPNKFDNIGDVENGYVVATINKKSGLIDLKGNTILPFQYSYLGSFKNAYSLSFKENSKMGLIDLKGNILLNPEFDFIYTSEDIAYLTKENKKGIADKYGNILLPTEYRDGFKRHFNEGLIVLEKDKKFGYANKKGQIIIPMIYDEAGNFSEGLAPVLKNGKWGFINSKGETVIDFNFVGVVKSFQNGFASYGKRNFSSGAHYTSDLWGAIDKKGNLVIKNKYYNVTTGYNGNFIVEIDGKKLLIDKNENVIALLKYEKRPVEMELGN